MRQKMVDLKGVDRCQSGRPILYMGCYSPLDVNLDQGPMKEIPLGGLESLRQGGVGLEVVEVEKS